MITLDEETHIYYWDGVKVPGVTEVLTRTGIVKYPDVAAMRQARYRGTVVHKAVELWCKGTLDELSLSNQPALAELNVQGYLDGAKRFIDDSVAKIVRFEWVVGHFMWRYGGKLDLLYVSRDGRLVVNDWKTGPIPWWIELQTCSYLEAIISDDSHELESDELWHGAVQLCPDGTYKPRYVSKERKAFGLFRQALNIVNTTDRRRV